MNNIYKDKSEYAVSTFLFENEPLETAIREISRYGFSFIEIWGDNVHLDPRINPDVAAIRKNLKDNRLKVHSVHTPFRNFPVFSAASEGEAWRMTFWKKFLDICSELEIPIAVIHAINRKEYNYGYDHAGYLHDLLQTLASYARHRGIKLALENIPSGERPESEILCTLTEQTGLFGDISDLYWCLDFGHVTITNNDIQKEIDCSFDRLISFHVHNNDGLSDSHFLPDEGVIDWPKWYYYLREKGYNGQFVLEIFCGDNPFEQMKKVASLFE
jgi:sugar phosphate isomerase/epimerase